MAKNLKPVKQTATYELVADQIQRAVHMGLLVPGDRLPPERELAQQLGVSRMTLLAAIRMLAHDGRVITRRGKQGGIWITSQDVSRRELVRLAADTDKAIEDVYDFRETVEKTSARLAAERARPEDIRKLRELIREMKAILAAHLKHPVPSQVPNFLALDSQFHVGIARASGNAFISESVEQALAARYSPFGAVFRVLTQNANDGHDELIDAIEARQAARAEHVMSTHINNARTGLVAGLRAHLRRD